MKKLFSVLLLLVALSMPAFAGRVTGGGAWCDNVDCVTCLDESCGGGNTNAVGSPVTESGHTTPGAADFSMPGLVLLTLALLMLFKLRS